MSRFAYTIEYPDGHEVVRQVVSRDEAVEEVGEQVVQEAERYGHAHGGVAVNLTAEEER
jgi:hypothetical protein